MAKRKKKPTKANSAKRPANAVASPAAAENEEVETSDIVLTEVKTKPSKEQRKQAKLAEKNNKQKKKAKDEAPKRHRVREVFSELKKVNWPSFKKTCKQTGAVLVVVLVFMLVVLGFDTLLGWLISLIGKI